MYSCLFVAPAPSIIPQELVLATAQCPCNVSRRKLLLNLVGPQTDFFNCMELYSTFCPVIHLLHLHHCYLCPSACPSSWCHCLFATDADCNVAWNIHQLVCCNISASCHRCPGQSHAGGTHASLHQLRRLRLLSHLTNFLLCTCLTSSLHCVVSTSHVSTSHPQWPP